MDSSICMLLWYLKSDESGHALKAASDTISYFLNLFLHFFENSNFCFTNILFHFENELQKWKLVSLSISFSGVLTDANINICSEKC